MFFPDLCVCVFEIFYPSIINSMSESHFRIVIRPNESPARESTRHYLWSIEYATDTKREYKGIRCNSLCNATFAIALPFLTSKQRFHCLENPSLLHQYAIIVRLINLNERRVLSGKPTRCKHASFVARISQRVRTSHFSKLIPRIISY